MGIAPLKQWIIEHVARMGIVRRSRPNSRHGPGEWIGIILHLDFAARLIKQQQLHLGIKLNMHLITSYILLHETYYIPIVVHWSKYLINWDMHGICLYVIG